MGRRATGDLFQSICLLDSAGHNLPRSESPSSRLFHRQRPSRVGLDLKGVMITIDFNDDLF
jgi:hypothetical protein